MIFERPQQSVADSLAGGEAGLGEIWAAAREQMILVDNSYAREAALERAYDRRNAEVFRDTGFMPENPYRPSAAELERSVEERRFSGTQGFKHWRDRLESEWQHQVAEAASRIPDTAVVNRLTQPIGTTAAAIAREADERLARLNGSRPGIGGFAATIGGGIAGALRDPLQVGALFIGGGPGAGRTIGTRILSAAAREVFVNGATEAALQPMVQAWRRDAGLDAGLAEGLRNVAFAALLGGVFGSGLQGGIELGARLTGRSLDAAGRAAAEDPRVAEQVRRAIAGDIEAQRAVLPPIREALPAPARGALDHAEILDHLDRTRPAAAAPDVHDRAVVDAHRALERDEPARFEPDTEQTARIADQLFTPPPQSAQPQSLTEFILGHGGLVDDAGELAARDFKHLTAKPRRGKPDRRMKLDHAREIAEEAGYLGRGDEVQVSTVNDLLDALDGEARGQKVYPRGEGPAGADLDAERARVEAAVADVQSWIGPAVDDALVRQAAEMVLREGMDAADAVERVLTRAELDAPSAPPAVRVGEIPPGWSDEELMAASAARGDAPSPEGGLDDPATPDSEPFRLDDEADMLIPGDDGQLVPLAAYEADIARLNDAAFMLENCRL